MTSPRPAVALCGALGLALAWPPAAPGLGAGPRDGFPRGPEEVFAPRPEGEAVDLVLFGGARPVVLRLRVTVAGAGYRTAWGSFFGRLHAYLDRDGDGVLTAAEADRLIWPHVFQNPFNVNPRFSPGRAAAAVDVSPGDGRVSPEELAEHARAALGVGALKALIGPPPNPGTEALFGQLDRDGDRALSPDELAGAAGRLARLDRDEDESIDLEEMTPDRSPFTDVAYMVKLNDEGDDSPVVALASEESRGRAARRVLGRFGRGGRIGPDMLTADPAAFRAADHDGDGSLDLTELESFLKNPPPDLTVDVALGRPGPSPPTLRKALDAAGRPSPAAVAEPGNTLVAGFDGLEVEIHAVDVVRDLGGSAVNEFKAADRDKSGAVDAEETRGSNQLRHLLLIADRDGDGKLTEPELVAYRALARDATASRVQMMSFDLGLALHQRLDADRDRRLSTRELREASRRLGALDRDRDGRLTRDEVPRRYVLQVGRGFGLIQGFLIAAPTPKAPSGPGRVETPTWFRGMDRNRDGDVSPREFQGPAEVFQAIDVDGDGLIDAVEAARAQNPSTNLAPVRGNDRVRETVTRRTALSRAGLELELEPP